jgi:hypothetical protein
VLKINGDRRKSPSSFDLSGPIVIYTDGSVERLDRSTSPERLAELFGVRY